MVVAATAVAVEQALDPMDEKYEYRYKNTLKYLDSGQRLIKTV